MKETVKVVAVVIIAVSIAVQSFFFWKFNNNAQVLAQYQQTMQKVDTNVKGLIEKLVALNNPKVNEILGKK